MLTKINQGLILESYSPALVSVYHLSNHINLKYSTDRFWLHRVPKNGLNAEVFESHGLDAANTAMSFK